jgi:copper transport protein
MRRLLLVAAVALVTAQPAWAHATFVRSTPADGATLRRAPAAVRVEFDDGIRAGPRNAAVSADGASVLAGRARIVGGKTIVLPLEKLDKGDYTARWSIVSDDGHQEEGIVVFSVGTGQPPGAATLTARGLVTWQRVVARTLFLLGALAAVGAAAFALLVLRPLRLEEQLRRPQSHLMFFAFLAAFLGSDALVHAAGAGGTRFEHVIQAAATVAAIGGAAAALTPVYPWLRSIAWTAAGLLFLAPTLSGHALDRDQPTLIAPLLDLAHVGAAAIWFGGLLSLAYVVARAPEEARTLVVRRFSAIALGSVVVVVVSGTGRALTELDSVSQLWTTSYGRAILAKTALLVPLVLLGWLNRAALLGVFSRLRRSVLVEATLLVGVAIAVSVLTDTRPGVVVAAADAAAASEAPSVAQRPPAPPAGAFVDGRELGTNAVGLAVGDGKATVTVMGPDGTGVNGLQVSVDSFRARSCGDGCYRTIATATPSEVRIGRSRLDFDVPLRLRNGRRLLQRATRAFQQARSIEFEERLASNPRNTQVSQFRLVAPDRMAYGIAGGPEAVVIGRERWDRSPGEKWVKSPQTPLDVPTPYWSSATQNVYLAAPDTLTFYDAKLPAWFRLRVAPHTARPLDLRMTAAAHFMTDRYSSYDRRLDVSPPSR